MPGNDWRPCAGSPRSPTPSRPKRPSTGGLPGPCAAVSQILRRLVATLRAHCDGIVAYFRTRITNATAETLNGIIQTIKRKARGFRTLRCLRTMTYLVAGHLDLQITRAFPV